MAGILPHVGTVDYATGATPHAGSNARLAILLVGSLGFATLSFCFCVVCLSVFRTNATDSISPWATSAVINAQLAANVSQGRPLFAVLLTMAAACGLASIGLMFAVLRLARANS